MLHSKNGGAQDPYKTGVIDTMVAEIQNVPGDDRCVLLLGYKEQMEDMFKASARLHDQKPALTHESGC